MLFTWWNAYYVINNTSEKAQTVFNIRLNNYGEETKNPNAITACRHFERQGHNFNSHIKFTITDKPVNNSTSKTNTTQKLLDPETKNSIRTEHKTQQTENEGHLAAFSFSFLPRPKHPSHLRI